MSDENRRLNDDAITNMAGDIGYIRSKIETILIASDDHEDRITKVEDSKNTARGFLIGAAMIAGTTGSAVQSIITKMLEHLSP